MRQDRRLGCDLERPVVIAAVRVTRAQTPAVAARRDPRQRATSLRASHRSSPGRRPLRQPAAHPRCWCAGGRRVGVCVGQRRSIPAEGARLLGAACPGPRCARYRAGCLNTSSDRADPTAATRRSTRLRSWRPTTASGAHPPRDPEILAPAREHQRHVGRARRPPTPRHGRRPIRTE
jgi:hypothetical protein